MNRRLFFLGLFVIAASCGCMSWTKRGDVLVSDGKAHWGFPMATNPAYFMRAPAVKIGVIGSTVIRVRDLPQPMLPEYAEIKISGRETSMLMQNPQWRNAVFQFTFRSIDGATLATTRVAMRDWESWERPAGSFRISPWSTGPFAKLPPPPDLLSYDLVVDVIVPWPRPQDLTIDAWRPNPPEAETAPKSPER